MTDPPSPTPALPRRLAASPRHASLHVLFTVPFVLQVVVAVGLTGYLSFRNGQKAVNELANQLRLTASRQISAHLHQYMAGPAQINQVNQELMDLGLLNPQDFTRMERLFWRQMQIFDVGYINFANEYEEFIGIERLDNGDLLINEVRCPNLDVLLVYSTDAEGSRDNLEESVEDESDIRQEDWYADAAQARQPVWSSGRAASWSDLGRVAGRGGVAFYLYSPGGVSARISCVYALPRSTGGPPTPIVSAGTGTGHSSH